MSNIMVLGAGVMQVPLIRKIKEMGHRAVVVGIAGNYPGIPVADKAIFENFTNCHVVGKIARQEQIEGICTCGFDLPVRTLAYVSEVLGLPGISVEAGKKVTDKMRMKDAFVRYGVRTARHLRVQTEKDGQKAFAELNKPVMFKAVDSQGSRGIVKVDRLDQIAYAYECVRNATNLNYYLVEEYIEGKEFGAQSFVVDGKIQFVLPHGDYIFHGDTGVPIGHYVPLDLTPTAQLDCEEQLQKCVEALDLKTCAINADFILSNGQVYVLEIGARCGATMLAETVSIYYGFDYYEKMVLACLGQPVDFLPHTGGMPNATMTLYSERDGVIRSICNDNPANPDIIAITFDHPVGTPVRKFRLGIDRLGHIIVKGETPETAEALLNQTLAQIHIDVV